MKEQNLLLFYHLSKMLQLFFRIIAKISFNFSTAHFADKK